VLAEVAVPADDAQWLERARTQTVEGLVALVGAMRGGRGAPTPTEDDFLEDEPSARLRIACPGRVRVLWRHTLELARRAAGEPLPTWGAAELIAAEGIAGRPAGMSVGDRVLRVWLRLTRRRSRGRTGEADAGRGAVAPCATKPAPRADAARAGNAVTPDAIAVEAPSVVDEVVENPPADLVADVSDLDAFALDARLREAMQAIRTAEPQIGRHLRLLVDHHLYRALGFRSVDAYVRECLGISPRKAWALIKVEKTARRTPEFGEAYARGTLSWVRALTIIPVLDRVTAGAWIARAHTVTVRRLTDEVSWVLDQRDVHGLEVPLALPPLDAVLISPMTAARAAVTESGNASPSAEERAAECHEASSVQIGACAVSSAVSSAAWTQSVTPPRGLLEVCDAEIDFTGPLTVVALFRDAMEAFDRAGEPRWVAVERLLNGVIAEWEAQPRHRDPVFARDGWRCRVPACSARRELQDHHLTFRSRGGSNARSNRIAICAAHHLHGIHAGVIRASGRAPHAVRWELGVRAGAPAFLTFVGDRVCATGVDAATARRGSMTG
jgi:hypothetical protein